MTTKKSKSCPHVFSRLMLATSAALVLFGASPSFANENGAQALQACSGTTIPNSCTISSGSQALTLTGNGDSKTLTITGTGTVSGGDKGITVSGSNWTIEISKAGENESGGKVTGNVHGIGVNSANTTINNSGSIVASGNRSYYGISVEAGANNTKITNTGLISSTGSNNTVGVMWQASGGSGSITNIESGSIVGGVNAIKVTGKLETISNQGTISGGTMAIVLSGSGSISTITNSGSILGASTHGIQVMNTSTISTLTNESTGLIKTTWNAFSLGNSGSIGTLTNKGTLESTNNGGRGIYLTNSASITTVSLEGSGQINAGLGVMIDSASGTITTLNVKDTSSIQSKSHAISNAGTITTIKIGDKTTTVVGLGDEGGAGGAEGGEEPAPVTNVVINAGGAGIKNSNTIKDITVTNSASITTGGNGIENSNTAKSSTIDTISITSGAQVKSSSSGIWSSGTIKTISVLGTSEVTNLSRNATPQASLLSGTNGIANDGTINKIEVKDGGQISGSTSGIQNTGTIDVIHVGSGSLIAGGQYGIKNTSTGVINGIIVESGGQISGGTKDIWNQGTIKPVQDATPEEEQENGQTYRSNRSTLSTVGVTCDKVAICVVGDTSKLGSILNEAVASGSGDSLQYVGGMIDGDILVQGTVTNRADDVATGIAISNGANATVNGSIIGSSGSISSVVNAGTITGDINITATAGQTVTLSNTKANGIEGKITFNGASDQSSTLKIQTWNTDIVKGEDGQPTFKHVSIDGQNGKVEVGDVVVTGVDGNVAKGSIDVKSVFSYSGYSADNPISVESVKMSDALAGAGWSGNLDKETGIFQTDFSTERSAGGIMGQTLVGQLTRRDFFLDSVLTQSAADALYNRIKDGNSGLVFAKPYVSFDSFDFDGNKVSGDTVGGIFGATGFITSHVITGFIGVEKSSLDSRYVNARMQLDSTSVYGGVSVAHVITSSDKVDTFGRVTAKVGYTRTDVDRDLNAELSHGSTDTLSYGGDLQLGANFKLSPVSRIVPMLGVGYSAGQTDDYAMENSVSLKDSYKPGSVDIPYVVGSVTWHQVWMDYLRSYFTAGVRYNLKTEQTSTAVFDGAEVSGSYELPDYYEYVSAAINMKLSRHSQFTYGYTGVFDKTGQSHNLLVQYQYLF